MPMPSEEEIYNDIVRYIESKKRNRPCVLASIKKKLRTPKIIDLIFSRPDYFKLSSEIKFVPPEYLTEELLVRYILAKPEDLSSLDEKLVTMPVLVAFEFGKRRYEHRSAIQWGAYRDKLTITNKYKEYRDAVSEICDKLPSKYDDEELLRNYLLCVEKVSKEIIEFFKTFNEEVTKNPTSYSSKYSTVDFDLDKRLFIFVSGCPDSGKTTFSNLLSSMIKGSICFDSDMLLEKDMLTTPLSRLVRKEVKVVVFSDIYASKFFPDSEIGDAYVTNILVEPSSVELMYRHSKYMQGIPYEDYKKYEIAKIRYNDLSNPIRVTNDYTGRIVTQIDNALDEIIRRLELLGLKRLDEGEVEPEGAALKIKMVEARNS